MALRDEILARSDLSAFITNRDCDAIASAISVGRVAVGECWLTDRGLIAELTLSTGSTAMSDSVLNKLDSAAAASRSVKSLLSRLQSDPKGLDFGEASMRAWFSTSGIFSASEVTSLMGLANQPATVSARDVAIALYNDDGSMK